MSIKRNSQGEVVFSTNDDHEVESALRHIFNTTEVGQDYKKNYATMDRIDEDYDKLVRAASQIAGGSYIHEGHLQHALTLLIDSGELRPKAATQATQLEDPEEDTRPRDKNGKLLTQAQIQWGEFARFAESASTFEINQRKASDPAFRQFVETNLRREMIPAEDGIPQVKKSRVSQELADFAFKYNREPIANLRPKGGFVTLAGGQIPWSEFQNLMAKAMAAGAI